MRDEDEDPRSPRHAGNGQAIRKAYVEAMGVDQRQGAKMALAGLRMVETVGEVMDRKSSGGAGYAIDRVTRDYAYAATMTRHLPAAPGICFFRRFLDRMGFKGELVFHAGEERDHVFVSDDFLAFREASRSMKPSLALLKEGVFYNYSPMTPIGFGAKMPVILKGVESVEDIQIEFLGARLVRRGEKLNVMGLFGCSGIEQSVIATIAKWFGIDYGDAGIILTVGCTIDDTSTDMAYGWMAHEVYTSDAFIGTSSVEADCWFREACRQRGDGADLDAMSSRMVMTAMEALTDMMLLPDYFAFRKDLIVEERKEADEAPRKAGRTRDRRRDERKFRIVSAIRRVPASASRGARKSEDERRTVSPPSHAVEVDGHWRTLREDAIGKGPNGEPVVGQTFVRSHERFAHLPKREHKPVVLVKEPVRRHLASFGDEKPGAAA